MEKENNTTEVKSTCSYYIKMTFLFFLLFVFLVFPFVPIRSVSCEDVCVVSKKNTVYSGALMWHVVAFLKAGSSYEHKMYFATDSVFSVVEIGDTVRVYGEKYMLKRSGRYLFCEDCKDNKQRKLWRLNDREFLDNHFKIKP